MPNHKWRHQTRPLQARSAGGNEEGGAPGVMWSDYYCDGFATETQKREVRLMREHMSKMRG